MYNDVCPVVSVLSIIFKSILLRVIVRQFDICRASDTVLFFTEIKNHKIHTVSNIHLTAHYKTTISNEVPSAYIQS